MNSQRNVAILGSTGSIGTQALDIIRSNHHTLYAHTLVAGSNYKLLIEQALEFEPQAVVIAQEEYYPIIRDTLQSRGIAVYSGSKAIEEVVQAPEIEVVLTAMVGFSGLRPTLSAIACGKTIALANKETLVVAGGLIMRSAHNYGAQILPVDSEHSAIYQCLVGESTKPEKILLTASGGPFRGKTRRDLECVTPAQALRHPNWSMGVKVTIDSASLMNKGLEMIEARWLFDILPQNIEVLVHPQSIIHSMVQFADGSIKAQLGIPDMRLPIGYALGLSERIANDYPRLNFAQYTFSFESPNLEAFPNLTLAYSAIKRGGGAPCILNAANEVAVSAFLDGKIGFPAMSDLVEDMLSIVPYSAGESLEELEQLDATVRRLAIDRLSHYSLS